MVDATAPADIMDHGSIRRGFPTVNNALARQTALNGVSVGHLATLLGDSLHVEAMQLIHNGTRSAGSEQARLAIDVILEGSRRAGAAQFLDVLGWRFMEPRMSDPEILLREVKVMGFQGGLVFMSYCALDRLRCWIRQDTMAS